MARPLHGKQHVSHLKVVKYQFIIDELNYSSCVFPTFTSTTAPAKVNFISQIDHLIDWQSIERLIRQHYAPASDVVCRPAYPVLLLFNMLLVGLWHGGLSDEAVEDRSPVNLHILCFLGLALEDDIPDHSVLSRFVVERSFGNQQRWFDSKILRYRGLAKAHAWPIHLAVAYNLKRLPILVVERLVPRLPQAKST